MSLLTVHNVSHWFGPDEVLSGVSLRLEWGQRMGLVGPNGCGKTTLLRILDGALEPTSGKVTYATGLRIGYLRQEEPVGMDRTVLAEAEDAFRPVLEMEARMRELEQALAKGEGDALEEYSLLQDRFREMHGFESLRDVRLVLLRIGFSESDLDKPTSLLSGGERTRLALAKLLLLGPDVLFLDEPTNHLDLAAIEWLEEFIASFGGAVLVVSHDRVFLDRVATHMADIEDRRLTVYKGTFSAYWRQKQERRERQLEEFRRQQEEIARLEEYVRRYMGTQKTNMAKSRLKMAQRLIRDGKAPPATDPRFRLKLSTVTRSGDIVATWEGVSKFHGERRLLEELDLTVRLGERVGIIGPNGSGKSTLVRILMDREEPTSGRAWMGSNVQAGYFAQDNVELDSSKAVIDHILDGCDMTANEARSYLGRFLFTGDDVYRPVAKLSGGEKNKLVLAQLILLKPNLLVLDEPTNHLDVASREALTDCLKEYGGTLILVSHDRHLLEQVTRRTLNVANGSVFDYPGSYTEYRAHLATPPPPPAKRDKRSKSAPPPPGPMNAHRLSKERARAKQAVADAEAAAHDAEQRLRDLESRLWHPGARDDVLALSRQHEELAREVKDAVAAWESAASYAESLGVEL